MSETMPDAITRTLDIVNKRGLHARASARFVEMANGFNARVSVEKDGLDVDGTSILDLMMLAASPGCHITVRTKGPDAEPAMDAIAALIADRFGGLATLIAGSFLQMLALAFYIPFDGLASLYVVSAIFGLAQGGIVPSYALIIRDHFPAREAGVRISAVLTATVLGMALGGWMSGAIYDLTGSYQAAFVNGIVWNVLNLGIALWILRVRHPGGSAPHVATA